MNNLGQILLFLSWSLCLYGFLAGIYCGLRQSNIFRHIQLTTIFAAVCSFSSIIVLAWLFLNDYYANQYVWQYSNKSMSWIYKITSVWGGMDGSMLLWASLLTCFSGITAASSRSYHPEFRPWLLAVLNSSGLFFLTVVLYFTNPFRYIGADFIPPDGNGLNPLLQNPYMAIHPPTLYLGFTALSVPYAFCLAALLSKKLDINWLKYSCRWTLIAWGFLTAGITLGGHWAYLELGWGGFWAWDPVENSSFLPWLIATAYLHSVMVQERRGILKVWNVILIVAAYGLTVFGTFLTRSGIVQSVHAFAETDIGWMFLIYLSLIILVAAVLIAMRWKLLQPEQKISSLFSREVFFLMNNIIFVGICFATFWGVMFPVLSEALTGKKQAVGIPFFNTINVPLFLFMLALMSVGPLVAWKQGSWKDFKAKFTAPFVCSLVLGLVLVFVGVTGIQTIISYTCVSLILLTLMGEYHRGARRYQKSKELSYVQGFKTNLKSHRRRFAGYLVHIGVAIAAIGITASMAGKLEKDFSISVGESHTVGEYRLELNDLEEIETDNYMALQGRLTAYRNDSSYYATLEPQLRRYLRNQESTTEVALKMGLKNDLYLVLAGLDDTGTRASFKVFINPLQVWLWFGVLIMIMGTLLIITDRKLVSYD